jgi:hypothetical protein
MQTVGIKWVKSIQTLGIQIERYVHDNDFQTLVMGDIRSKWVDFSTSFSGDMNFKNLILSASLEVIRSYNYQFLYRPVFENTSFFWDPGKDVYNYQGKISMTYRF